MKTLTPKKEKMLETVKTLKDRINTAFSKNPEMFEKINIKYINLKLLEDSEREILVVSFIYDLINDSKPSSLPYFQFKVFRIYMSIAIDIRTYSFKLINERTYTFPRLEMVKDFKSKGTVSGERYWEDTFNSTYMDAYYNYILDSKPIIEKSINSTVGIYTENEHTGFKMKSMGNTLQLFRMPVESVKFDLDNIYYLKDGSLNYAPHFYLNEDIRFVRDKMRKHSHCYCIEFPESDEEKYGKTPVTYQNQKTPFCIDEEKCLEFFDPNLKKYEYMGSYRKRETYEDYHTYRFQMSREIHYMFEKCDKCGKYEAKRQVNKCFHCNIDDIDINDLMNLSVSKSSGGEHLIHSRMRHGGAGGAYCFGGREYWVNNHLSNKKNLDIIKLIKLYMSNLKDAHPYMINNLLIKGFPNTISTLTSLFTSQCLSRFTIKVDHSFSTECYCHYCINAKLTFLTVKDYYLPKMFVNNERVNIISKNDAIDNLKKVMSHLEGNNKIIFDIIQHLTEIEAKQYYVREYTDKYIIDQIKELKR